MLTPTQPARFFFSGLATRTFVRRPVPPQAESKLRSMAALCPSLPPPAEPGALPRLPDETLAHYGEQYLQFVAPWKKIAGAVIPNFYQFVIWQERMNADAHRCHENHQ